MRRKWKKNIYLEKLWTAMILYRCLLLTSDLLKAVEKLSKHVVEGICPSKRTILKNYSMFYFEIENSVLPLRNVSVSYAIAMHSKSQIFFAGSINKFRTWKWFTETFSSVWLLLHADSLTHFFSSFIMELTAKIHLRLS